MPRNGSGTYAGPSSSWNPATIPSAAVTADWNALLADISAAITQSLSRDGQSPPTANLPMASFKLTGLAAGSGNGDSLRYEQLIGASPAMGAPTATTQAVTDSSTKVATTAFVRLFRQVGQVVSSESGAVATGATVIPLDDTIPQKTEGDQYMSLAITPASATSTLRIDVVIQVANSATNNMIAALFQDNANDALAAMVQNQPNVNGTTVLKFTHYMTSGTTSATTFKVRAGGGNAGTTTFNGASGARLFGGVMASSISITEYLP